MSHRPTRVLSMELKCTFILSYRTFPDPSFFCLTIPPLYNLYLFSFSFTPSPQVSNKNANTLKEVLLVSCFRPCSNICSFDATVIDLLQDVLLKIVRKEGIPALWKGFTPCYLRIGPHTVLTFIFLEQFNVAAKRFYGVPV